MKKDADHSLGDLLKAARSRRGISQGGLSQKSRVSTRTIVAIENGKTTESLRKDVIARLALALNVDPAEWGCDFDPQEIERLSQSIGLKPGETLSYCQLTSAEQVVSGWMKLPRAEQRTVFAMFEAALKTFPKDEQ